MTSRFLFVSDGRLNSIIIIIFDAVLLLLRSYFHFTLQASKREQDYDEKIKSLENEYGEVMNCG